MSNTKTTTNFEDWLAENEPDNPMELQALYHAVTEISDETIYSATQDGGRVFLKGPCSTLLLASAKARNTFISQVMKLNHDSELDIDEAADFWRAIDNPKS